VRNTLTHGSEGKYLGVFIKKDLGNVYIDIADKGKGIDKEHLPFVFERLYKVDSARSRGGGIGLAIAKELAIKMNGNIEILLSIPGDTVFRITFPEAE
jgi:signal transduction histidine kinase